MCHAIKGIISNNHRLSSSADKTIRFWNVATGDCIALFQQHQHWVWSLAHYLDHDFLLSSSQDETIKVWNLETGTHLKTLRCPRPYEGTLITEATGLTETQKVTLQASGAIEGVKTMLNKLYAAEAR